MPSKSVPRPTASGPASLITCSMWSTTFATGTGGRGGRASISLLISAAARFGSPSYCWRIRSAGSCSASSAARAASTSPWSRNTDDTLIITTPPLAPIRRMWSSVRLRGRLASARHEECDAKIGAREVSSASSIVSSETCETSTIIPRRFISRTTARPKSLRP